MSHKPDSFLHISPSTLISLLIILALLIPMQASPALAAGTDQHSLSPQVALTMVDVSAQNLNLIFDADGVIVVNDLTTPFTPEGSDGEAVLQTRLFPKAQGRVIGNSRYAYLYRVDLRNLVSKSATPVCVSQLSIPFGPIARLDYDGDQGLEDVFIITQGGMGNLGPTSVVQSDASGEVVFDFKQPICSGAKQGSGDSSFFIGLASLQPYQEGNVQATLTPAGSNHNLAARFPFPADKAVCQAISSPKAIPSSALINFDTLKDQDPILDKYLASYGINFIEGTKVQALVDPIQAHSSPNVAYRPYSVGAAPVMGFSFASPVMHVGFYASNISDTSVDAQLTAYDGQMSQICQFTTPLPPNSIYTFLGVYDPLQRISRVSLAYSGAAIPIIIDDLYLTGSSAQTPTEFPQPETSLGDGGPEIILTRSDNLHLVATFNLPDPSFWMMPTGGTVDPITRRLRFGLPGTELNGGAQGSPDIPVFQRLIAIPKGATPTLPSPAVVARTEFMADLYPSQPSAMDNDTDPPPPDPRDWTNPPYFMDPAAYLKNEMFPKEAAAIYPLGQMRDLNLALLVVAGGQYNPVTRKLITFRSVDVDVAFTGGLGYFLPDYSNNPFEPSIKAQSGGILNAETLGMYTGPILAQAICQGNELLIVTHPNFLAAAQTLAAWKIEKGIATRIVQTSDSGLGTPQGIKDFIQQQYDICTVRPSYLLLLGDAEFVGAFYHPGSPYTDSTYSDLDYALLTPGDTFPDLAYGRIPVDTLDQANIVVNKIIAYEKNPPTLASFYNTVTLASFFECCSQTNSGKAWDDRSFVEASETARAALIFSGKVVNRIYTTNISNVNNLRPTYYRNGAPLPSSIGYSSGFAWNGSTANIINAFNGGTGLIMHRDHGGFTGWGDPYFQVENLSALTNGNLTPVVYSVNCASGMWDNELAAPSFYLKVTDVSWIERMLRMEGGAVTLIGDTRNSPTWANSALARGLFDATWPLTIPSYGNVTVHRRIGDILNYAKLYLYTQVGVTQTAGEIDSVMYEYENRIFHVIGDPTLELWKNQPNRTLVRSARLHWVTSGSVGQQAQSAQGLVVDYPIEGAQITILQGGLPVGRGVVSGGQAIITFVAQVDPSLPLQISASLEDNISVAITQAVYLPLVTH